MVTLNDYLYSGATVFRILKKYTQDLRASAKVSKNEVALVHCNFLIQIMELLEHNDFLTAQSQKIREFYKYMAMEYPYLSFTFKGRIKSLIRAEGKFNGYIVEYIYDYYKKHKSYPDIAELKEKLNCFRDLIAYRIVISMPRCHLKNHENREEEELKHLYQIANVLPQFLEERGFTAESTGGVLRSSSPLLDDAVKPYYRDYITSEKEDDYKSLQRYLLLEDDIVINRVNSIEYLGKCAHIKDLLEDTVYESNMMRMHFDPEYYNPVYICKLLCSQFIYDQIVNHAKKSVNQASINQKDVLDFNIYQPPLDLQNEFANFVQQVDKSKVAVLKIF